MVARLECSGTWDRRFCEKLLDGVLLANNQDGGASVQLVAPTDWHPSFAIGTAYGNHRQATFGQRTLADRFALE